MWSVKQDYNAKAEQHRGLKKALFISYMKNKQPVQNTLLWVETYIFLIFAKTLLSMSVCFQCSAG